MKLYGLRILEGFTFLIIAIGIYFILYHWVNQPWIISSPKTTFHTLFRKSIWWISSKTLFESTIGLLFAIILGFLWALILNQIKFLQNAFTPFGIILQASPVVALAPIIHFAVMHINKSLIVNNNTACLIINTIFAFLVCINPIVLYTLKGLDERPEEKYNFITSKGAGKNKIFWFLTLPNSIPKFLDGILVAIPLSIVGAVVSEMIVAPIGLGNILNQGNHNTDPGMIFASLIIIALISTILYLIALSITKSIKTHRFLIHSE